MHAKEHSRPKFLQLHYFSTLSAMRKLLQFSTSLQTQIKSKQTITHSSTLQHENLSNWNTNRPLIIHAKSGQLKLFHAKFIKHFCNKKKFLRKQPWFWRFNNFVPQKKHLIRRKVCNLDHKRHWNSVLNNKTTETWSSNIQKPTRNPVMFLLSYFTKKTKPQWIS